MSRFVGLAALVTGGGSGIGLATARLLASEGARVAVLDLRPGEPGDGIRAYAADVRTRAFPGEAESYHLSAEVAETLGLYGRPH